MSPLQERLMELRAKVRQLLWVHGLCWLTAVLLGTLLLVGWCDWLLHLDDAGVRLILGLGIVGTVGYVAYRRLIAPLQVPLTDLDLALRIERRFPQFRDALASTIQFLQSEKDPLVGAPELQQRVIDQTLKQAKFVDFEDVVQSKPVQRIGWTALVVFLTTALVVGFNRAEAETALRRLVFPFGTNPWPRQVRFQVSLHQEGGRVITLTEDGKYVIDTQDKKRVTMDEEGRIITLEENGAMVPLNQDRDGELFTLDQDGKIVTFDPHLQKRNPPLRFARGDTVEFKAVNLNRGGRLPQAVHLEFKHPDGSITREPMQKTSLKESSEVTREVAFSSLVIKKPFEFRTMGGDNESQEWFPVEVVTPPVVQDLRVTLTPPKYSGRPEVKLPTGMGHIEGLVGTMVRIQASANKPLGTSYIRVKDKDQYPLVISSDGLKLTGSFTIKEPGVHSYWLDLRDQQSFGNSDAPRYEIRAIQDTVPDIYIDIPATDMHVTAKAEIPLRFVSKDDLGLRDIRMQYSLQASEGADPSPLVEVPLKTPDNKPLLYTYTYEKTYENKNAPPRKVSAWELQPLNLKEGMKIQFHAEATDYFDLGPSHVGRSIVRTLTIVSDDQKKLELNNRQTGLLDQLNRLNKQESDIAAKTGELKKQLEKTSSLRSQDLDLLQRLEGQQRQVTTALQNDQDGILAKTQAILKELEQNHIVAPDTKQRLDQIQSELQRLSTAHLPEIEQQLTQARKEVTGADSPTQHSPNPDGDKSTDPIPESQKPAVNEQTLPGGTGTETPASEQKNPSAATPPKVEKVPEKPRAGASVAEQALHRAQHHEQAVTEALDELLRELSQWQDERDAMAGLQEIRKGQEKVRQETAKLLSNETLGKLPHDLKPQQQADLAKQAERQDQTAQQVDQLQRKLGDVVQKLSDQDPDVAGRLQDALDQLRQNNTADKMRAATKQISENSIGKAAETQELVSKQLESLESILKNEAGSDLETLVKQIDQAEKDLTSLQEEQEELVKKVQDAERQPDPKLKEEQLEQLQRKQEELQRKAEQLARKLERLKLDGPAKAAQRAAERMKETREELQKETSGRADEQGQEAVEDLEQARRELAQEKQQIEEVLAQEQLEKVSDEIKALAARQQSIGAEIKSLDEEHQTKGNWTRPQLKTLRDLAESQRGLQRETQGLVEKLSAARVFALAAKGAARNMEHAAASLDKARSDDKETAAAQRFAQAAAQRFQDLLDAMKPETLKKPDSGDAEAQPGNTGGGEQQAAPLDAVALIAELKMLRSMQVDLNARLLTLAEKRDRGNPLTTAELGELKKLGEEQGELAELTTKFLELFDPGKAK